MENTATLTKSNYHEGDELRLMVRRSGLTQDEYAANLGMTRQNLNYHMRKRIFDGDFKRLLHEKGIILSSDSTKKPEMFFAEHEENIPFNIPLKKKRMAKVILPKDSKSADIDTVISHLKLMKDSME